MVITTKLVLRHPWPMPRFHGTAAIVFAGRPRVFSSVTGPSPPSKTWERSAKLIKATELNQAVPTTTTTTRKNPYLDRIREAHDPSMHLKSIEDELKGTIGQALGRQGAKIQNAIRRMNEQYVTYQEILLKKHQHHHHHHHHDDDDQYHPEVIQAATTFNQYRADAVQARWELMVHRQAVGFIVNNHEYVQKDYPIPEPLPISRRKVDQASLATINGEKGKQLGEKTNEFGDQLDWWQRIGRWK
jgi:hypothetical protein